ncbi:MAG: ethanolamine ammonia-lyase reactivating factor EutA [Oscillospiraceae bacterium]|nr:ethanolamine ammonia-lyase reactivating factor EutA [Oscillospiraceae bacterium]
MDKQLLSVGLDVGTTTTQLVFSQLQVRNRGSAFTVPRMEITDRHILYKSPVHFTPLLSGDLIDGEKLRLLVEVEYQKAGIRRSEVDTGAVIITGETSRKENAATVVEMLSDFAGDFVVATAGPELESALAARGAGALQASEAAPVLHMDIGGGTSNLALCREGNIEAVGCLNVGGRLIKFDAHHRITYLSPVLQGRIPLSVGEIITRDAAWEIAEKLAAILEMAAGRREKTPEFTHFLTPGAGEMAPQPEAIPSFSGGVADCIDREHPWDAYGDLGPLLGQAIRESNLCRGNYRLGSETIRATVIGAGCYSTQLSGSTVFLRGAALPVKNLPVAVPEAENAVSIRRALESQDAWGVLHLPGRNAPDYGYIRTLADAVAEATGEKPCYVALKADMAKALGHALALRLPDHVPILCLDGLHIPRQSYLDIGNPVGPAVSVVIKTLAFENH